MNYLIQVILLSALFTIVYYLLFNKSKHFQLRRFFILSIPIFSFLIPFSGKIFTINTNVKSTIIVSEVLKGITIGTGKTQNIITKLNTEDIFVFLYTLVATSLIIRLLLQIRKVYQFKKESQFINGIYYLNNQKQAFSFFHLLFVPNEQIAEINLIIQHEKIHIQQKHSIDIIYFELLNALFWFNPVFYFLKQELKDVHEFFVDELLLENDTDLEKYCKILMRKSPLGQLSIGNNFKQSQIKKRFIMMTKKKNKKWNLVKASALLMIIFTSSLIFANNSTNINLENQQELSLQNEEDSVYQFSIIEKKPEFPGGMKALQMWIVNHVQYPKIAKEKGIQGRVFVSFEINREGEVENVKVKRGVNPLLDNEAVRVISIMPKWKPGEQKGKPVKVQYFIPINFKTTVTHE